MSKLKILIVAFSTSLVIGGIAGAQPKKKSVASNQTYSFGVNANELGAGAQSSGSRTCRIPPNAGAITDANVEIQADCSLPPDGSYLDGIFMAPPGATVVVQKDGADDLTLVAKVDGNANFTSNPFKFPKLYSNNRSPGIR